MKTELTPGRWRGLKTTSTPDDVFAILAFDQRESYIKMLPDGTSGDDAVHIKREIVVPLSASASAVLLDPVYGLPAAMAIAGASGLLMALEKSGYTGDSTYRRVDFIDGWTVAKIKRLGASAVKLLVYYHPDAGELSSEIENVVSRVIADCREQDMPLFLEPVSYSLDAQTPKDSQAFAETRPEVVRNTALRLGRLKPDVLKLEFPVDAKWNADPSAWRSACQAVSEASEVPWVLLSAGVDFSIFERQAQIACESGASGVLAGRAIWKESVGMAAGERQTFIKDVALPRLETLKSIATRTARPWTDFYQPARFPDNWYESY